MSFTLRVSVLDQCQLRCRYCLPTGTSTFLPKSHWLTLQQYEKIATAMLPLSIDKVRFTGGEPLLRADLPAIIRTFSQIFTKAELALTTNGLRFVPKALELLRSGLHAVTFHLDSLKNERYRRIMGAGDVACVLDAIRHAQSLTFKVKLNVVVQRDVNDDELGDFLRLSQEMSVQVRFIELMNTGSARAYVEDAFISGKDILEKIACLTRITALGRKNPSAPAELFMAPDLGIKFGLIASDTRPFCANCNRLRLSADGRLRTCLYEPAGHDVGFGRAVVPSDEEIAKNIAAVVAKKTSFHPGLKKELKQFSMSQIGG